MKKKSPRKEEYLETIYKLQEMKGPASTSRIAEHLGLSPSSVSEMLKQLVRKGLLEYAEKGVKLTEEGEHAAKKVIRKHRLSERLLTDLLGFGWEEVHEEACRLEHDISREMEEKIVEKLGNPRTCPHGHPIPDKDGQVADSTARPLSEFLAHEKGVVKRVFEENPEMLQYLGSLGLYPEIEIEVKSVAPFGGPILIRAGGAENSLGKELAEKILVEKV